MVAQSVERRIAIAEREQADALVFELDSEIGSHDACARIAAMIRESTIKRSFAWVRTKAVGNSALIALACQEIILADGAELGGINAFDYRRGRLRGVTDQQLADRWLKLAQSMVDDARRTNDVLGDYVRDEPLHMALAFGDLSLWWVRDLSTGREFSLDEGEMLRFLPNASTTDAPVATAASIGLALPAQGVRPPGWLVGAPRGSPQPLQGVLTQPHADLPAGSPTLAFIANSYASEPSALASMRPQLGPQSRGQLEVVARIWNGTGPFKLSGEQMAQFGLAANRSRTPDGRGWQLDAINTDDELRAFLGATTLARLTPSVSDGVMSALTHPFTRMVLIVIFFAMMFVEMLKPGTLVAGFISASALLLFIAPAFLLGLASWWEVLAIGLGIVLLAVEVFVLPGFGVPGIMGLLLLLWGLVGTFSPQGSGMFSPGFMQSAELSRLLWATLMVLGSLLTAGLVVWLVVRQFGEIPLFRKLVLTNEGDVTPGTLTTSDMQPADTFVSLYDQGITLTRMTPVGRVEIRGRIVDCVSDASLLPAGQQVHVSSVSGIRIGVSPGPAPVSEGGMQAEGGADAGSDGTGQGPSERS